MMISRLFFSFALLSGSSLVAAQSCGTSNSGACKWEPFNPLTCGPDNACGYENFCLARENGFNVETDCCQAPQPSGCTQESAPHTCGNRNCPYPNLCVASLAGYSQNQCTPVPPECPTGTDDCSQSPSNPFKCGPSKSCPYDNICALQSAGWNMDTDCCQDVRGNSACGAIFAPVSCGPPQRQCPYDSQCVADAAGYNNQQCCAAVPDGTVCTSISAPVQCGDNPCSYPSQCQATAAGYTEDKCCRVPEGPVACTADNRPVQCGPYNCEYSNQCIASAAGHSEADCCPAVQGACTLENDPVLCDGKCTYGGQSCADAAGFTSAQCCKQPKDLSSCTQEINPLACSRANCRYDNPCIATLAGFDPNSCVQLGPTALSAGAGDNSTDSGASTMSYISSVVALFTFLFV